MDHGGAGRRMSGARRMSGQRDPPEADVRMDNLRDRFLTKIRSSIIDVPRRESELSTGPALADYVPLHLTRHHHKKKDPEDNMFKQYLKENGDVHAMHELGQRSGWKHDKDLERWHLSIKDNARYESLLFDVRCRHGNFEEESKELMGKHSASQRQSFSRSAKDTHCNSAQELRKLKKLLEPKKHKSTLRRSGISSLKEFFSSGGSPHPDEADATQHDDHRAAGSNAVPIDNQGSPEADADISGSLARTGSGISESNDLRRSLSLLGDLHDDLKASFGMRYQQQGSKDVSAVSDTSASLPIGDNRNASSNTVTSDEACMHTKPEHRTGSEEDSAQSPDGDIPAVAGVPAAPIHFGSDALLHVAAVHAAAYDSDLKMKEHAASSSDQAHVAEEAVTRSLPHVVESMDETNAAVEEEPLASGEITETDAGKADVVEDAGQCPTSSQSAASRQQRPQTMSVFVFRNADRLHAGEPVFLRQWQMSSMEVLLQACSKVCKPFIAPAEALLTRDLRPLKSVEDLQPGMTYLLKGREAVLPPVLFFEHPEPKGLSLRCLRKAREAGVRSVIEAGHRSSHLQAAAAKCLPQTLSGSMSTGSMPSKPGSPPYHWERRVGSAGTVPSRSGSPKWQAHGRVNCALAWGGQVRGESHKDFSNWDLLRNSQRGRPETR